MSFGLTLADVEPVEFGLYFKEAKPLADSLTPDRAINARNLHAFLEVGRDFSNWIKDRIASLQLIDNKDFVFFAKSGEKSGRGRHPKEYYLALEAAEEICMGEGNAKGKEARKFYIKCRKDLLALRQSAATTVETAARQLLDDPRFTLQLVASYAEKVVTLEAENAVLAPKARIADRVAIAEKSAITPTEAAKTLGVKRNVLIEVLLANGWAMRFGKYNRLMPKAPYDQRGLMIFNNEPTDIHEHGTGKVLRTVLSEQLYITPKGLAALATLF